MSSMVILDVVIAALLLTTIAYCWRLGNKIERLREGKKDLANFLGEFNLSIARAEESITQLRSMTNETDNLLREQIQKARYLANDLSFLVEKGENLAESLEDYMANSRPFSAAPAQRRQQSQPAAPRQPRMQRSADDYPMQLTNAQMVRTLEESSPPASFPSGNRVQTMTPAKKNALDSVLAQIAARKSANSRMRTASDNNTGGADNEKPASIGELAASIRNLQRVE